MTDSLKVLTFAPVANEHIVKALEEILEDAKAGRVEAFAISYVDNRGCTLTRFTNTHTARLLGATSHVLYRLNKYWDEQE